MALVAAGVEGVIESIGPDGTGVAMVVMGVKVVIDPLAFKMKKVRSTSTPRVRLTIPQILSIAKFKGLPGDGFIGGTAIVSGNYNTDTGAIEVKFEPKLPDGREAPEPHPSVDVGTPENVLIGAVTGLNSAGLAVNKVPVVFQDPAELRLPSKPPCNDSGFDILIDSVPVDTPASVAGYYSTQLKQFVGLDFIVGGPATLKPGISPVSITRARARNLDTEYSIDLRGGVITTGLSANPLPVIRIFRIDFVGTPAVRQETPLGGAIVRLRPDGFTRWNFNQTITAPPPLDPALPALNRAPDLVIARFTLNGVVKGDSPDRDGDVVIFKE